MNKLEQLINKIEAAERLGRFAYKDGSGCMCAVGHVFEDCGMLDKVLENPFNNKKFIYTLNAPSGLYDLIESEYGLIRADLEDLQRINDNEESPAKRKQLVIQFLRLAGEIVG